MLSPEPPPYFRDVAKVGGVLRGDQDKTTLQLRIVLCRRPFLSKILKIEIFWIFWYGNTVAFCHEIAAMLIKSAKNIKVLNITYAFPIFLSSFFLKPSLFFFLTFGGFRPKRF